MSKCLLMPDALKIAPYPIFGFNRSRKELKLLSLTLHVRHPSGHQVLLESGNRLSRSSSDSVIDVRQDPGCDLRSAF